jgi:hypothetical protein
MKTLCRILPFFLPALPVPAQETKPFAQSLELQGVTFKVECPNAGSQNKLTVTPKGLAENNDRIVTGIDGTVAKAQVADLNGDGSPELYVFVQNAGSGSYGSLAAWSANKKKSLSEITLPELTDDKKASKGYMGHDEFEVVENTLVRRFPVYQEGDPNSKPTGKTRQVQYKLHAGEAGWILRADKVVDY